MLKRKNKKGKTHFPLLEGSHSKALLSATSLGSRLWVGTWEAAGQVQPWGRGRVVPMLSGAQFTQTTEFPGVSNQGGGVEALAKV